MPQFYDKKMSHTRCKSRDYDADEVQHTDGLLDKARDAKDRALRLTREKTKKEKDADDVFLRKEPLYEHAFHELQKVLAEPIFVERYQASTMRENSLAALNSALEVMLKDLARVHGEVYPPSGTGTPETHTSVCTKCCKLRI